EKNSFNSPKTAGAPPGPGGITPLALPAPGGPNLSRPGVPPTSASTAAAAGPTIVGRNAGANTTSAAPLPGAGYNPATAFNNNQPRTAETGGSSGLRSIPSRAVRTAPATPQSNLSPEEQVIMIEAQRLKAAQAGIPLP